MVFRGLAATAILLIGVAGPASQVSAQYYSQPMDGRGYIQSAPLPPPSMPDGFSNAEERQEELRPPMVIGPAPNVTGAIPQTRGGLPADVRPESGPEKDLPPQFQRTLVDYRTTEPIGTIIVDTSNTYLYLVLEKGKAMRYGIGVGREGFTW